MDAVVTEVVEPMEERTAKSGKTYKAMKVEVELESGETERVLSFNLIKVGDSVKLKKNGEYWNIDAPRQSQVDLTPVLEALKFVAEQNKQILARLPSKSGYDVAKEKAKEIKDKVEPVDIDEEINLDDIPF